MEWRIKSIPCKIARYTAEEYAKLWQEIQNLTGETMIGVVKDMDFYARIDRNTVNSVENKKSDKRYA